MLTINLETEPIFRNARLKSVQNLTFQTSGNVPCVVQRKKSESIDLIPANKHINNIFSLSTTNVALKRRRNASDIFAGDPINSRDLRTNPLKPT